ncbi:CSN-associated deubiquitinating enzyme Ubp12 [Lambiella insularis]|nr:CSN-associated deubiquitinating enzyme Ubp12 [Lambiella insularis]
MILNRLLIPTALLGAANVCRVAALASSTTLSTIASPFEPATTSTLQSDSPAASASVTAGVDALCFPSDASGSPLVDAPCNKVYNLTTICVYGSLNAGDSSPRRDPAEQQSCYCDSDGQGAMFFEYLAGCFNCERLAGADQDDNAWYPVQYIASQSYSFCAIPTPSQGLAQFLGNWTASSGINIGTSTGGSNILGTSTQVSLYFTSTSLPARTVLAATIKSGDSTATILANSTGAVDSNDPTKECSELPPLGQLIDITSSYKKRKLSKPDIFEDTSTSSGSHHQSGSQDLKPSSPSAPRPIPPHLLTQESFARRSPTPDISSTAASSPSAAYAGLTLDGEARGGDVTGSSDTVGHSDNSRLSAHRGALGGIFGPARSASPAKRLRSEMETEHIEDVDTTDDSSTPAPEAIGNPTFPRTTQTNSRVSDPQKKREQSVDMLESLDEDDHNENSSKDSMADDTGEYSSTGAYLTPQSGVSISSSSATSKTPNNTSTTPNGTNSPDVPSRLVYPECALPSIDDQIAQVMRLAQALPQDGQKGYVISLKWLNRVLARGTQLRKSGKQTKEVMEGEIGPVDNTGLNLITDPTSSGFRDEAGDPYVPLKPGVQIAEDFEIIPQDAWDLIMKWYGLAKGSPILTRYCHNTSTSETADNLQYELHPPIFTILKLPDRSLGLTPQAMKEKDLLPVKILASRHERYQNFLKRAKSAVHVDIKTRIRVWRILSDLKDYSQAGMLTPAQSRSASPAPNVAAPIDPGKRMVVDLPIFMSLQEGSQRELIEMKDETMNENYNGHSNLDLAGLSQEGVIVLEEQVGGPAGGEWVSGAAKVLMDSNGVAVSVTKNGATTVASNSLKPKANTSSGRTSPAIGSGIMTRGRTQKNGRTRGTVGLGNLGNTCYMNSALQCVRSVKELTNYFLEDYWKKELNPRNPLAHNGEVAKAYAALLKEMYGVNSNPSFTPRNFKQIIGKYGPSFSGYGQQDSQEFLLFLLDGLQEDLNRIHKKPYIEKPDSTDEMVNNPAALRQMADKCWDIYKARNDSVITDLFAGMYKSTVVCPVCEKVSIIFDPFNNLTLQLPIENSWSKNLFFFPLSARPLQIDVDVDKNATFLDLKEYIAGKVGVEPRRMVIAEVYKNKFFKVFDDKACINDERIADGDSIAVFELEDIPTNYPPPKKKKPKVRSMMSYNNSDEEEDVPEGDSVLADKMLVAVFHRLNKDSSSRHQLRQVAGVPTYIVLTREEAKDYNTILRKVLNRVATMTTLDILGDGEETRSDTDSSAQQDSDTVLMTTDDVDSSSDSKVQAMSVDSEDSMVDITMKKPREDASFPRISYPPKPVELTRLKRLLQPGDFIEPGLRRLFEMKFFSGTGIIPIGWNTLQDENKNYPTLLSRMAEHRVVKPKFSVKQTLNRHIHNSGSSSTSDEDTDDPPPAVNSMSSMQVDEAYNSEESDGLPDVRQLMNPQNRGHSRFKKRKPGSRMGLITYSRKGRRTGAARGNDESSSEEAQGPLLQLGEALILDWSNESYDSLFHLPNEGNDDGLRGSPTWDNVPVLPDPELHERRLARASRKKTGVSLGDCLDEFGKTEILSENDAWFCPRCKEHRRASKKFELWKSPDILVIHLKRFSAQGRLRDKIDVLVDFPTEGLDLSSRVVVQEEGKSPIYDLFAVDNHYGGLGGGHYTAFAQNFNDQSWYEYNDSMATKKNNPNAIVTSAAYLLFYRRRSSKALGGPVFEQMGQPNTENTQGGSTSQPPSRAASPSAPAGEGKRLDEFSRNGSSSASQGVEAVHQAGSGGLQAGMLTATRIKDNESPPGYSHELHDGEQTIESMEIDDPSGGQPIHEIIGPTWAGFGRMHDAPSSDNLFEDNGSMKANSSTGATDVGDARSLDDDFGPRGHLRFGTPEERPEDNETPLLMDHRPVAAGEDTQDHVTEVNLPDDGGESFKMD